MIFGPVSSDKETLGTRSPKIHPFNFLVIRPLLLQTEDYDRDGERSI